jgi:hypothetical protein
MIALERALSFVRSLESEAGGLEAWPGAPQYNECTGYILPTLMAHYELFLADRCAHWLITRQNKDGSWNGLDDIARPFDTAACVEGLRAMDYIPGAMEAVERGEAYLWSMRRDDGVMRVNANNNENRCYSMRVSGIIGDATPAKYWMSELPNLTKERSHYIAYCLEGLWKVGKHDFVKDWLEQAYRKFGPVMPMTWDGKSDDYCATAQFGILRAWAGLDYSDILSALRGRVDSDGSIQLSSANRVTPLWAMKFYLDLETEAAPKVEYEPVNAVAVVVGIGRWQDITGPFVISLLRNNPGLPVLVIDNASDTPYPESPYFRTIRLPERVGYNLAMNAAIKAEPGRDWYILFNNDCMCHGNFSKDIPSLDKRTVYGSGWNECKLNSLMFQWSAWLCLSDRAIRYVGLFDKELTGAYEDFDYQYRAQVKGFKIDTWDIPVNHLDKHTRFDEKGYGLRREKSRDHFSQKHGLIV